MLLNGIFDPSILDMVKQSLEGGNNLRLITKDVLSKLGIGDINAKGNIPDNGPLLIISNHPGVFDSIILLSRAQRDDLYFVALRTYGIFGKKISDRLLPIELKRKLNHYLYEYPLSLQMKTPFRRSLTIREIQSKNRETIAKAATLINKEHAVSIFPTGSAGKKLKDSNWKPGVGYLVNQITNDGTRVVFGYIGGTRQTDIFAYMKPIIRKLLFKKRPILVAFSKPIMLTDMIKKGIGPKQITIEIEAQYLNWVMKLK